MFLLPKQNVGGQAVIEGVMMRNEDHYAVAIRKPDKEIIIDERHHESFTSRYKVLGLPFIRGIVAFVESMVIGMQILTFSAEFFDVDDTEESKFDRWLNDKLGDKANDVIIMISVLMAMVMAVGLFVLVPLGLSHLLKPLLPGDGYLVNFVDGVIRMGVFLIYILLISRMKDIQRVFQYHGAEHKSIHCYEAGLELTVENAKKQTRLHKRCGTSFIVYIVAISVVLLTIINAETLAARFLVRIVMLPVIAGISYEVLKWIGRSESRGLAIFAKPGLYMQKITTAEPDDSQLEVAIAALKQVLVKEESTEKVLKQKDEVQHELHDSPVA